jgi:hypothetical protein
MALATIAQVAASGLTIRCLEVPKIAYATSGKMLEYSPTTGLNPANCAYATATGNATAATEIPATRSCVKSRENRYSSSEGKPGAMRLSRSDRLSSLMNRFATICTRAVFRSLEAAATERKRSLD